MPHQTKLSDIFYKRGQYHNLSLLYARERKSGSVSVSSNTIFSLLPFTRNLVPNECCSHKGTSRMHVMQGEITHNVKRLHHINASFYEKIVTSTTTGELRFSWQMFCLRTPSATPPIFSATTNFQPLPPLTPDSDTLNLIFLFVVLVISHNSWKKVRRPKALVSIISPSRPLRVNR